MKDKSGLYSVICDKHDWGEHIDLKCKVCGTMYSTKNISCIGARTIFIKDVAEPYCKHLMNDGVKVLEHICE